MTFPAAKDLCAKIAQVETEDGWQETPTGIPESSGHSIRAISGYVAVT